MEKRVAVVCDGGRIAKDDRYYVEAYFAPIISGTGGEGPRGTYDMPLLLEIYRPVRAPELSGLAGFHLDKYQDVAIARDQIDFGIGAWAVIPSDDGEATAAQKAMRKVFAVAAQRRIGIQDFSFSALASGISATPEQLAGLGEPTTSFFFAARCHSMTLPRIR